MVPFVTVLHGLTVRAAVAAALAGATLAAALATGATGGLMPADGRPVMSPGLRADLIADGVSAEPATAPGNELETDRPTAATLTPAAAGLRAASSNSGHGRPRHGGTNHVWSSELGLNRSVAWFACSRSGTPGMAVYRWGCAGSNNVYLFAHAGGPFRRLHDLYVSGRLRRGLTVTYADRNGIVHRYRVAWWRVVLPTRGDFAFAAQSRPSMTLQTCVGAHDRYRLVVRLLQTD